MADEEPVSPDSEQPVEEEKPSDEVSPPLVNGGEVEPVEEKVDDEKEKPDNVSTTGKSEIVEAQEKPKERKKRKGFATTSRPVTGVGKKVMTMEDTREMQRHLKQLKEKRRGDVDERYRYLFSTMATALNIDENVVEDMVLGDDKFDNIEKFFVPNGSRVIMFYYQDNSKEASTVRFDANVTGGGANKRLFISSGSNEPLLGVCLYFIRVNVEKNITNQNLAQDVNFGMVDATGGKVLDAIESHLESVTVPSLKACGMDTWGMLKNNQNGVIKDFLDLLDKFLITLLAAKGSLEGQINLQLYEYGPIVEGLKSPQAYLAAAQSSETTEKLETLLELWCKEIETVLAESEQIRREADDVGPSAELDHWKKRMATFNSLLDQIKNPRCRAVVFALQAAKSRVLRRWRDLDKRITDAANEAKDNVKYLYTLDKFFGPLSSSDPKNMIDLLPSLLNAIKMIHTISQYYNTSERMTSLFVKVTNQMITTCKAYIREGVSNIREMDRDLLLSRITDCLNLRDEYKNEFRKVKDRSNEESEEKSFDFSENYIFGKFDAFCRRLEKIQAMMDTIGHLSGLADVRVEGIDLLAVKFQNIVMASKKKSYDILDQRKGEFDNDYEEFRNQIDSLLGQLQSFIDSQFEKNISTTRALLLLEKFERIKVPQDARLDLLEKYFIVLMRYDKNLESCRKTYMKQKNDPPIPRNMPPIAGKIAWARQLFRKIEEPMKIFMQKQEILKSPKAKKIIKNYNKTAAVLLEFEMLYHRGWFRAVDAAKSGLSASLLIEENDQFYVNFDPQIFELIDESKHMQKMGLELPPAAEDLILNEAETKSNHRLVTTVIDNYYKVIQGIPPLLKPLIKPYKKHLENVVLKPGLLEFSWQSANIQSFCDDCNEQIEELTHLISTVSDILNCRIDAIFAEMEKTPLCSLPEDETLAPSDFLILTRKTCSKAFESLKTQSLMIEAAVIELIDTLKKALHSMTKVPEDVAESLQQDFYPCVNPEGKHKTRCMECLPCSYYNALNFFTQRNTESLVKCTKLSLDSIRKRLQVASIYGKTKEADESKQPLFKADICLKIPSIKVQPSLEDIQKTLTESVQEILNLAKEFPMWKHAIVQQRQQQKEFELQQEQNKDDKVVQSFTQKPLHKIISDHKDIVKVVIPLQSVISSNKVEIEEQLKEFDRFSTLWVAEPHESVKKFQETEPLMSDYGIEMKKYQNLENDINALQPTVRVGAILLITELLQQALIQETRNWKWAYGIALNEVASTKMQEIFDFIENLSKRLSRPIKDLDDIRNAMSALMEIREQFIHIEMTIMPIEEAYAILNRFDLTFKDGNAERVDSLTYNWKKLITLSKSVQDTLLEVQPGFKGNLLDGIKVFKEDLSNFVGDYTERGPMAKGIKPREASDRLVVAQAKFDELFRKYQTYSGGEELFGLPVTEYHELMKIKKELNLLQKLYSLYNDVIDTVNGYNDIPWSDVDIEKINQELIDFQNKCRKLPKALKDWEAFEELKRTIDDFNETCPLLDMMANKSMKIRHWERIATLTSHTFDVESENFLLRNIVEAPLLEHKEDIEDICISAVKEKDIEAKLKQVVADWSVQSFQFSNFKARGELLLKGQETSEIIALMEDSLMILGGLMSNRYNAPFKAEIQKWVHKLSATTEIIENWMIVQNLWVYLEAVFVGGDIAKQLPQEAKRFSNIDKSWVKIMTHAHENSNVVQCCVGDDMLGQLLPHLLEQLELCQKSLTGYLEKKRLIFPRFFFVSDPALLEILGQASDSHTIQAHLLNIFDNVATVTFHDKEYDKILAFNSREKESVDFDKPVMAQGNVEIWLGTLLNEQRKSLHSVIRRANIAVGDPGFKLIEFEHQFPAQVGLLGIQIFWTHESENALNNARFDKKAMPTTAQMFGDVLSELIEQTTHDLTKIERTKFETLITIHVHQKDIFDELVKRSIKSIGDFEWLKQSRFYFNEETDSCQVKITDVTFTYMNEYLGCTDRLVITPLTDRCYITLAQALGMSMGGAPAGPAGTGKTETTKDMGRCLGKYVVVFNCSDQMDFRGLGRIYKGLAQSGSWGCFDEFNRIDLPVLSVAAQQIYIVLQAKKDRKSSFIFTDGDNVSMDPEFGLFITMNPGYAGRQELPENLKIQFRSVAMMVPDRQIIMRVKLASVGFQNNIILARKFFTLYKLCEEQLTKQVHYDFGLRNILSVLRTLGGEKRANPQDSEQIIVMRVLRDMNLSKLVDEDEPLFLSLINDLFPGIELDKKGYPDIEAAIAKQVEAAQLIYHPTWVLKLIQLYETQRVRWGMMALGPSGAGKTCCIHTLMKAMTDCGAPHKEMRMNPKAITAPQMFGRLDAATSDWTDGIFSTLWRRTHKVKKSENVWIVLDGPVDAIWIENLNSVLDDNKTLTLANGDRIVMAPNCKVVFEPHNIDNASPATVSRNGMVFMSSSVLNWNPLVRAWCLKQPPVVGDTLIPIYEKIFAELHLYIKQNLTPKMDLLEAMYVRQSLDMLDGLLPQDEQALKTVDPAYLKRLFIFAIMWSLGAVLELDDRAKMQEWLKKEGGDLDFPAISGEETIFEYFVNTSGKWEHWSSKVPTYEYPVDSTPEYAGILVPNVDNIRTDFLIQTIANQEKGILLIGEQGTAKTVMIKGFMKKYDPEYHLIKSMNFSSATEPIMFQRTIESYVDKRVGTTYGPPANKKMTVFIDDINMPVINDWGDQITNEIVRQAMEQRGFYNLEKPGEFTNIVDIQYIAAMIHPGGGRNDIPQRLKRRFNVFNCTLPSNASIDKIFQTIGLGHYVSERGFSANVIQLIGKLVPTVRILWQKTKVKMLPTPAKFHYVFNLRDLSKIWQGMINTISETVNSEKIVIELFKHECTRVISDRFVSYDDVHWFDKEIKKVTSEEIDADYVQYLEKEPYFVDFLREAPEPTGEEPDDADLSAPKIYEPIESFDQLKAKLNEYQDQYNEAIRGANMDLVFFNDCMCHLMKISRIIRTPRGNALLVGVGGSGKQSLTRLASFVAGYKSFQITLTRAYNATNLLDDLKYLYRVAGQHGQGMTFIFTDNEIKDEGFLEYMNNLLATGEVSNLFARDELDEITGELIPVMKKEFPRRPPTGENLYDYFLTRVRNNLHVVLCFSPVGEKFRNRSLKFPGLISGCTMDWFQRWPRDALIAVSGHFLTPFEIASSPSTKTALINVMGEIHDGVAETCVDYFNRFRRQSHVTPKSYLSFLEGYKKIYKEKRDHLQMLAQRMRTGLDKLVEATESVNVLSKELAVKEKELAVASKEADVVLADVTEKQAGAEKVKQQVQVVKNRAQGLVDEIEADKEIATTKLLAAKPALEEAEAALQTIKPADIATVRKLGRPPHLVMRIMDTVLLLFQKRLDPVTVDPDRPGCFKPSWAESQKLMGNTSFLSMLQTYSKDTINEEMVELMAPYLEAEDYNLETGKKVSGNVAGLLSWTQAMSFFFGVNKEVLPLKANLAIQEGRLVSAQEELSVAQSQLDEKEAELLEVRAMYDGAMKKKQDLLDDAEACRRKMQNATTLIDGLSGERIRWTEASKQFEEQINRLIGDVLLATGFLSYSGPFNQEFRNVLLKSWRKLMAHSKIPYSDDLDLIQMLADNATIGEWNLQGLPNDDLSVQNGIITTKATRYPLLIDPQLQGKSWIKNKEKDNELQITSLNHKYFRNHLEDSLSLGRPLLIEDIKEELDPALDNILEKNFIRSGRTLKVKVGDKEVDVMDGFKLYVTTKIPNPSYTPEIYARTSIIDFTVTMKGLEDQLLGLVIVKEKQELEQERTNLLEEVTANKRKTQELEDNLLYRLTSTQGSLVEDESLIAVLQNTKTTAAEVKEKLKIAAETEIKINAAREEYRPVATRGSILYFLIVEMSMVNVMYQTSLKQFLGLFDNSILRSGKSPITTKRIFNIIDYLTYEVFRYTVRGLYEEHKFMFTLLLTLKIDLNLKKVKYDEFNTLIKGGAALDLNSVEPKPKKWIMDLAWLNLVQLSNLPQFGQILQQITRNDRAWKNWFDEDAPEEALIPDGYSTLDPFRKLLLIRSWCPDRTLAQARHYVIDSMGIKFAEGVILSLEGVWEESDPYTPMTCFLSMGSDPTDDIEKLAKKHGLQFRAISMGQGQEVHARRLLSQSQQDGGWVLFQNSHLGLDYMDEMLASVLSAENPHSSFRVWITTDVHASFPITLLQTSIKYTFDPPQGVKAGLKRTFAGVTQDQLDISNMPQWKILLYCVAFLHTTVQERRKFGPLGWNIPYEFNQSDYGATVQFCQNHLDDIDPKKGISWTTVRYMIGEVQYGGRVTDDYDKRLLNCFARTWFGEHIFTDNFCFYKGYSIPKCKLVEEFRNAIENLPLVDTPKVFGLHPNADITYQTNTANNVLDTILSIQPKDSGAGGGETRESVVYRLCSEFLEKLPNDYVPHEVKARLVKMGQLQPLNIFLKQEIDRMQRVIKTVRITLKDLRLAIDGTIIMNENLRDALDCMFDAKVPNFWKKISWESSTLGFWFSELLERNSQFESWVFQGRPNTFWLTGFFNPQGFLTAMRQEITRAHKGWALDTVILSNEMTKLMKEDIVSPPAEGVYIYGLYLDGAGWDRRGTRLIEASPKVLYTVVPVAHLFAVNQVIVKDPAKVYECPVYKKPRRTDLTYIFPLTLKSGVNHSDHWILRGVALLCDIK
uniref:Dynein heavy chain 5 n=1 Tax=Hofstenia miamia TaxID=442651 RepID=A0A8F3IEX5_HOFMI|nr:dynein heavy chain 5 [Hofstenia miamia]